jgi:hypothetical protein
MSGLGLADIPRFPRHVRFTCGLPSQLQAAPARPRERGLCGEIPIMQNPLSFGVIVEPTLIADFGAKSPRVTLGVTPK